MCYTTDEYATPKTEFTYSAQFPYGRDGYRTNCNNISVGYIFSVTQLIFWKKAGFISKMSEDNFRPHKERMHDQY